MRRVLVLNWNSNTKYWFAHPVSRVKCSQNDLTNRLLLYALSSFHNSAPTQFCSFFPIPYFYVHGWLQLVNRILLRALFVPLDLIGVNAMACDESSCRKCVIVGRVCDLILFSIGGEERISRSVSAFIADN